MKEGAGYQASSAGQTVESSGSSAAVTPFVEPEKPKAKKASTAVPGLTFPRFFSDEGVEVDVSKLSTRRDPDFAEDIAKVPLDRAWAEKEASTDLWVRQALPDQTGDLGLLGSQRFHRRSGSSTHLLPGCQELATSSFGKADHAHLGKHVVGPA